MRIVSLLPSATEIVCALGNGADLVGRSEECDYPAHVRDLPVVMRAKAWDADRPSAEIDARVQRTRGSGESLYALDIELLRRLRPEVLLTQDLCGVCSVTQEEVEAACALAGLSPKVVSLMPRTLAEVWDSIDEVGHAIGAEGAARRLSEGLRARSEPASRRPRPARVAVVEWLEPPIYAGLWTPEVIERAGGAPVGPTAGSAGHRTDWPAIAAERPDLLVVSPCSFAVERTRAELDGSSLGRAVASVAAPLGTWVADEAYFSRPGPRLADGIDLVRAILDGRPFRAPMPAAPWSLEAVA